MGILAGISADELRGGEHMRPRRRLDVLALGALLDGELFDIEGRQAEVVVMSAMATRRAGAAVAGLAKVVDGLPHGLDMCVARKALAQRRGRGRDFEQGPVMPGACR